jgi:hypothetical protein
MTSPNFPFEGRKTTVQDILSSFSREILPSEFRPELFTNIDLGQRDRPSEWTIAGDLEGTLMNWGVHDDDCYEFLKRAQPASTRSVLFHQKVVRRLTSEIERYRDVDRNMAPIDIREEVRQISNNLRAIVEEAWNRQKTEGRATRAKEFIDILNTVCEHHLDISGSGRRTRRSSGSQPEGSLFYMLIIELRPEQDHFMLGLLDWMANESADVLPPFTHTLEHIGGRLESLNAPEPYRNQFQGILDKVRGGLQGQESSSDYPPAPPPAPPPALRGKGGSSGTKRPAADVPGRRGGRRRIGS